MQGAAGHLASKTACQPVEVEQLVAIAVLDSCGQSDIPAAGGNQALHGGQFAFIAVLFPAEGIVPGADPVDGNGDFDLGVPGCDPLEGGSQQAIGRYFQVAGFGADQVHDVLEVGAQGGFAAGQNEAAKAGGQLGEEVDGYLLGRQSRVLPDMAHGAPRIAPVGQDER